MKLPAFSVKKPVLTTCALVAVFLLGLLAILSLRVDMLPKMDFPQITVLTVWNGASPSDCEQLVSRKIEDELSSVEGIKDISSTSLNDVSMVTLKFEWGMDLDLRMGDIRDKLDLAKRNLPKDIEQPILFKMSSSGMPIMVSTLTAKVSYPGLYRYADKVIKEEIQRVSGVGNVIVMGGIQREIAVQLHVDKLEAYKISTQEITAAIERENINVPAGTLKDGQTIYNIRLPGRFRNIQDMESVIVAIRQGHPIYLKEVATIHDGFKEPKQYAWVSTLEQEANQSVIVLVFKNTDANAVDVINRIEKRIDQLKANFPADVRYQNFFSQKAEINNALKSLSESLFVGLLLVFVVTWLFLKRIWASCIVCVSIPISLLLTCILMWLLGYTMNVYTLMALAMATGLVIDNAIVSMDQIMYRMELGERKEVASVLGASEIGGALIGSTSTSVVVLMPLFFIGGIVGVFFSSLCAVMVSALACSFLVAITFVPMLCSKMPSVQEDNFILHRYSERLLRGLERGFRALLDWAIRHTGFVLAAAVCFIFLTFSGAKYIGTELSPKVDSGRIEINFQLREGTRLEVTDILVRDIIQYIRTHVPELQRVYGEAGQSEGGIGALFGDEGPNVGSVSFRLVEKKLRKRTSFEVAEQLRVWLDSKPEFQSLNVMVRAVGDYSSEKPLLVEVYGADLTQIMDVAQQVRETLRGVLGVKDVSIVQKPNAPEVWVQVDREKAALMGVNNSQVGNTLRTLFFGTEMREKFWEKEEDYEINVRLEEGHKNDLEIREKLVVLNEMGSPVRLSAIASIENKMGPSEIFRNNRQRYIKVGANVFGRSLGDVVADATIEFEKMNLPAGVRLEWGGDVSDQAESFGNFGILMLLAFVLCYMVMAAQYEAYIDPLVMMVTVPFAFTGVIMTFLMMDLYISMQVILGMLMLVGVVVNHAIVYLDYVTLLRSRGALLKESLLEAGERRLRPILMTVLTAFFGMLPMAVSNGEGAEQWRAMSVCYMSGLVFSVLITLVLIPVLYHMIETRLRRKKRYVEGQMQIKRERVG